MLPNIDGNFNAQKVRTHQEVVLCLRGPVLGPDPKPDADMVPRPFVSFRLLSLELET